MQQMSMLISFASVAISTWTPPVSLSLSLSLFAESIHSGTNDGWRYQSGSVGVAFHAWLTVGEDKGRSRWLDNLAIGGLRPGGVS